mgnify:FL=1
MIELRLFVRQVVVFGRITQKDFLGSHAAFTPEFRASISAPERNSGSTF